MGVFERIGLILLVFSVLPAAAQMPLSQAQAQRFSGVFENAREKGDLPCKLDELKPFLDFSFRFESGFVVHCPIRAFDGKAAMIASILRVAPQNGTPVMLGQSLQIPPIPEEFKRKINMRHLSSEIEFSGVFVTGEGDYDVQLAVMDGAGRKTRKSWSIHAKAHGHERDAKIAIASETASAISYPLWDGTNSDGKGLRVTILMDAAPIHPYSMELRAWDRAFLLGSLSSLLRHLPLASVKLVAFNMDQQAEVFHEDDFDRSGLMRLSGALSKLELGTISYKKLQRQSGWAELLSGLIRAEAGAARPSDAVIFLGPTNRITERVPEEWLALSRGEQVPFFYFEYFPRVGREFPDTIQYATSKRGGTTYKLYSPGDLARSISKMKVALLKDDHSVRLTQ